jgi:hypothetical protein
MQTYDSEISGLYFGAGDMCFWYNRISKLGMPTNGGTNSGSSFVRPDEGRSALNNGERDITVLTAFQVLLVKPVEGLWGCQMMADGLKLLT